MFYNSVFACGVGYIFLFWLVMSCLCFSCVVMFAIVFSFLPVVLAISFMVIPGFSTMIFRISCPIFVGLCIMVSMYCSMYSVLFECLISGTWCIVYEHYIPRVFPITNNNLRYIKDYVKSLIDIAGREQYVVVAI